MINIFISVAIRFGTLSTMSDPVEPGGRSFSKSVGLVVWIGNGVVGFNVAVEKDSKIHDSRLKKFKYNSLIG